jgi:hypothetical protein
MDPQLDEARMTTDKDPGEAVRDARNEGLQQEAERLRDPEHHTPDEEQGGDPVPTSGDKPEDSIDRLKNPPQVEGPREDSNDMV